MKQLQNNYTTPEQSKRLLKLGVPADSADCCLRRILTDGGYCETWRVDIFDFIGQIHDDYLPCWSVGRLIEIIKICKVGITIWATLTLYDDIIAWCIDQMNRLDFSKLEDRP